jgi:hypothetical protein
MTQEPERGSDVTSPELLEGADGAGPRVSPEAVAPPPRLRSPILEHRAVGHPFLADDRPTVLVPPIRAFIGPAGVAALVAAPLLVMAGWQVALAAAAMAAVARDLDRRASRATFSLGDGFLPYRPDTGWPRGVQEEDDVHWNWTPIRNEGARG